MNTKGIFVAGLTMGAFLLAPPAFAEDETHAEKDMKSRAQQEATDPTRLEKKEAVESSQQTREHAQRKTGESHTFRASELIGYSVKNSEGQELGEIEDIVIDSEKGRVAYAVLSFGGFLGMGDKFFAIPWEAMKPMPEQEVIQFDVTKEKLEKAPGFNKDNWPDMANRDWGTQVHKYYDQDPYWE